MYCTLRLLKLDRDRKKILLNDKTSYSYDKIILCIEKASYMLQNHFVSRKGIQKMKNYFTVESLSSGKRCLDWFQSSCEKFHKDGYIIILGLNLHSLAIVNSLIETGAPAKNILIVKEHQFRYLASKHNS